ncbi:hypothetical protein [Corynebacterium crudilactis]|uniref:Uncharacterized protein n=1 Tax=Corynebacterium crudilactis TaxID=1652495 RepID=A0A172QTG8_9CORY|nr:hypothetical protein [Corynebacterium crudilactis]ANE03966.1 hypothetical protein ccrud_06905 [Corynebacterium crudilactis]
MIFYIFIFVFVFALIAGVKYARDKGKLKEFSIFAGGLSTVGFFTVIAVSIYTGGHTTDLIIAFLILAALLYPFWLLFKKIEKEIKQRK